jgi:hypothetical protein
MQLNVLEKMMESLTDSKNERDDEKKSSGRIREPGS